jgi:hypothetical protein
MSGTTLSFVKNSATITIISKKFEINPIAANLFVEPSSFAIETGKIIKNYQYDKFMTYTYHCLIENESDLIFLHPIWNVLSA